MIECKIFFVLLATPMILCAIYFFSITTRDEYLNVKIVQTINKKNSARKCISVECINLYKKKRNPNQKLVFRSPLRAPPPAMLNNFTAYGKMSITRDFYFNYAYYAP